MTKKTECRWGRATKMGELHFYSRGPNSPPGNMRMLLHGDDDTPCGGAKCPDQRAYPWAYWDDSGYDDEGVPIRDSRPERRAPGQETNRRKAERRTPCNNEYCTAHGALAHHYRCPNDGRGWRRSPNSDRRQPRCGNPACGELLCRADVMIPGSGSLLAARCTTHPRMHPETPHHADDGDPANPPGQPDGPCQRGRTAGDSIGVDATGAKQYMTADEAKPQSAGLVESPWRCDVTGNPVGTDTRMVGRPCQCQGCRAATEIERLKGALAEYKRWPHPLSKYGVVDLQARRAKGHERIRDLEAQAARYREVLDKYLACSNPTGEWVRETARKARHPEPDHD